MPRLEPLPPEAIEDLLPSLEATKNRMGFLPNSQLIMARRPEILRAFQQLAACVICARRLRLGRQPGEEFLLFDRAA